MPAIFEWLKPSKYGSFSPPSCKCLFRPLANQVPLNFRRQPESKSQHLTLNIRP